MSSSKEFIKISIFDGHTETLYELSLADQANYRLHFPRLFDYTSFFF